MDYDIIHSSNSGMVYDAEVIKVIADAMGKVYDNVIAV
jgi:hypothetical protein